MPNPPLDLHLDNMGSAMPQIADQDPERVMLYLGDHNITIVLPVLSAKKSFLTCLYPRSVQYAYCLL